jgi:hypothetical protein
VPQIIVEQSTFERLQRHAQPLVDTPDTLINRALDALEQLACLHAPEHRNAGSERRIDPRALPSLTHTRVLDAAVGGEQIAKANWNLLLAEMLRRAMKRVGSYDKLRLLCPVNMVHGQKEVEGYSYIPDIDISVQGQDANTACRNIVTAAQSLGIAINIGFMWRHKLGSAHPGERARLQILGMKETEAKAA